MWQHLHFDYNKVLNYLQQTIQFSFKYLNSTGGTGYDGFIYIQHPDRFSHHTRRRTKADRALLVSKFCANHEE